MALKCMQVYVCVWLCVCECVSVCVWWQGVGLLRATSAQAPLALFVCVHVFVFSSVSLCLFPSLYVCSLVCVCYVYMWWCVCVYVCVHKSTSPSLFARSAVAHENASYNIQAW